MLLSVKRLLPSIHRLHFQRHLSTSTNNNNSNSNSNSNDGWNDAWETAWLPDDLSGKNRAPWETDVTFPSSSPSPSTADTVDPDTKAFVAEMDERWNERRAAANKKANNNNSNKEEKEDLSLKKAADDYRVRKQRIHAGLWTKEIEKMEERKIGKDRDAAGAGGEDDIDRLLDSCNEIFDSGNIDLNDSKIPSTSEFKTKPDGWETTTKARDGNIWELSQNEEDILLQEYERRIAFSKHQIASFIKTHIFSRRRPVDGWKYMIEVVRPKSKRGSGSIPDPDPSKPFDDERPAIASNLTSFRGRGR